MKILRLLLLIPLALCFFGSGLRSQVSRPSQPIIDSPALDQIAFVHGVAGPFAVAGYRIGERALRELDQPRGTFTLEVVHKTPNEVQWTCIADGVQASTGVSVGKLNLKLVEAPAADVETVVTDRKSGRSLVFRLKPGFIQRYLNLPHAALTEAGREVLSLRDDQIFSLEVRQQ